MTPLQYHLVEIKLRVFYLLFSAFCTFFLCYNYQVELVYIISKPFIELQQTFVFLKLTEAFYTLLEISLLLTVFVLIPLCVYHFWSFIIPSFYKFERTSLNLVFLFLFFLFLSEVFFIYFTVLPKICHFLISFEMTSKLDHSGIYLEPIVSVEFTAQIGSYVELILQICSLTFVLFQIPLCVCFLYAKKILHVSSFYCNRKLLCLVSLLLSALVVPPDVLSQVGVALFFFLIFEFLIFIGFFFE